MNAQNNAYAGYSAAQRVGMSPRDAEYKALSLATSRLKAAKESGRKDSSQMIEAVSLNSQIWLKFAVDLANDGNKLPERLRGQLLSLALFSQREGRAVLRSDGKGDADALIDVNTAIMKGLRGDVAGGSA